jgi:hypothetical protein
MCSKFWAAASFSILCILHGKILLLGSFKIAKVEGEAVETRRSVANWLVASLGEETANFFSAKFSAGSIDESKRV